MPSERIEIVNDSGAVVKAMAPVIISASRSTDIPTYFPKWFISRFDLGHVYFSWYNPFYEKPVYDYF